MASNLKYISVNLALTKLFKGDMNLCFFFSFCLNKSQWISSEDGWFWHTYKQFSQEISMTRTKIDLCRKKLKEFDFWEEKKQSVESIPTNHQILHFRINEKQLEKAIEEIDFKSIKTPQISLIEKEEKKLEEIEKEEKNREIEANIAMPKEISIEVWKEWEDYRKAGKKALKQQTRIRQWNFLKKAHNDGYDPNEIINKTIERGWQGLEHGLTEIKKKNQQQFSNKAYEYNSKGSGIDFTTGEPFTFGKGYLSGFSSNM